MSQLPVSLGRPGVRVLVLVVNLLGLFGVLAAGSLLVAPAGAQPKPLSPDAAALMVLDSARRAYNEGNYPFAAQRFQEFLKQYGGHAESASAAYGLGLALMEAPQKDYKAVVEAFQRAAGRQDFADRPYALYYMGLAQRGMGEELLAQAQAKPNEAARYEEQATRSFQQALASFAAAAAALAERLKAPAPTTAPAQSAQPAELEWLARARCDQCEMLLRTGRYKEAGEQAAALLADPAMVQSRYRELAGYHLGYAAFAQRDYPGAGRALSKLAPFQQEFGPHSRYLLARTHHLSGERPEAAAQYKALLAGYEEEKKKAQESLKHAGALKPEQRAALSALVSGPPPDYVPRAMYYSALIQAEEARFAEALAGFTELLKQYPKCALAPEAQLRQGFCQLQLRNCPEAIRTLQPLTTPSGPGRSGHVVAGAGPDCRGRSGQRASP